MIAEEFIRLFVVYTVLFLSIGGMVVTAGLMWALIRWALDDGPADTTRAGLDGKEAS